MTIKLYKSQDYSKKLKVTIQSSGKLGFADPAAKDMQLSKDKSVAIGYDENNTEEMYLVVFDKKVDGAYDVMKSGTYYYLNTAMLFSSIGFDYKNKTIIFDLLRSSENDQEVGGKVYKMFPRIKEKKGGKMR